MIGDPANLRERLVARCVWMNGADAPLTNPDGPEALAEIDRLQAEVVDLREAAERGLEHAIEAANECKRGKDDPVFLNIMRDIERIEAALNQRPKG